MIWGEQEQETITTKMKERSYRPENKRGFVYGRRRTAGKQIDHSDGSLAKTPIGAALWQVHVQDLGFSAGSAVWMARNLMVDARPFMMKTALEIRPKVEKIKKRSLPSDQ